MGDTKNLKNIEFFFLTDSLKIANIGTIGVSFCFTKILTLPLLELPTNWTILATLVSENSARFLEFSIHPYMQFILHSIFPKLYMALFCLILMPKLLAGEKKKPTLQPNWKKDNAISMLSRDITFIGDSILTNYEHLVFAHQKPFAVMDNAQGKVSIWSRDARYRRDSLWNIADIQDLIISKDDKILAVVGYDSSNTGLLVSVFDLESLTLLHKTKIGSFLDLIFSPDHSHYFILQNGNKIEMRSTFSGDLERNFLIPQYDERNAYYTNIQRILISEAKPEQLLLFDIGPAEELSLIKKGIHINVYPFNYSTQSFDAPINLYFNGNPQENPPSKFSALAVSADGRNIFIGLKRKVLTYDLVRKRSLTNQVVGQPSYLRCDPNGRFLIVGNESTASLWEITLQDPNHSLRLLRQLLTKTKDLYFYDNQRYLVGNAIEGSRLAFFNAEPLLTIREKPSEFVRYATQKHTKKDLTLWFESMRRKSRLKDVSLDLKDASKEKYVKDLFNRNFQYYARELFNIASDYLYTPDAEPEEGEQLLYIYTNGFEPIEIKTTGRDFKRKQEAFIKGWYKWGKMEFGCTEEHLYIKKAQATINSYPYDYDESKNTMRVGNKLTLSFENFNLNSEKLN